MSDPEIQEFPVPDFLTLTPERLRENEATQKSWRESAGYSFSASDSQFARAVLIEQDAKHILDILAGQFSDAGEEERSNIVAAGLRERSRLAEAVATQGRFDEAAAIEQNEIKRAEYAELWEAIWREDEETCPCPAYRRLGSKEYPNDTHALDVFSLKHGTLMAVVKCGLCNFTNVRPLTTALLQQQGKQEWRRSRR